MEDEMKNFKFHVIIEGPDRVGKDTLSKNIRRYYRTTTFYNMHYDFINYGPEQNIHDKKMYDDMFKLMDMVRDESVRVLCNRSHIGDYVYGQLYRKSSNLYVFDLEKKYNLENILLVYLYSSVPEILMARDDGNSLSKNDLKKINQEQRLFEEAYELSVIPNKMCINVAMADPERVFEAFKMRYYEMTGGNYGQETE